MHRFPRFSVGLVLLSLIFSIRSASAQKVDASVLYRQDSDNRYIAIIPGYTGPESDITGACLLDPDPANCPQMDANGASGTPTYMVVGTTLSLLLPDGRVAVLNCQNRYSAKGDILNRRNCGMPMVPHVEADFIGLTARLTWPGAAGKKIESETYRVIAMLGKRTDTARVVTGDETAAH